MNIDLTCHHCNRAIKAPPGFAGKQVNCPGCKKPLTIPSIDAQRPATPPPPPTSAFAKSGEDDYRLADLGLDAPQPSNGTNVSSASLPPSSTGFADLDLPAVAIPAAVSVPTARQYSGPLPELRRYPALNIVRIALLSLAALVACVWFFMLFGMLIGIFFASRESAEAAVGVASISFTYMLVTLVGVAITCCLLIAAAELIRVVLDIQSNTLAAARRP